MKPWHVPPTDDDADEDSFAAALPATDEALTEWNVRTRGCSRCTTVGGLRRLCETCRASLPRAPKANYQKRMAAAAIAKANARRR